MALIRAQYNTMHVSLVFFLDPNEIVPEDTIATLPLKRFS